jgi:hypothetical protein
MGRINFGEKLERAPGLSHRERVNSERFEVAASDRKISRRIVAVNTVSAPRFNGSFGGLEQRELKYLRAISAPPSYCYLLLCLRVRLDGRRGAVLDSRATLADWTGLSERTITAGLKWLVEQKLITRKETRSGERYTWTTTPLPYDSWPVESAKSAPSPTRKKRVSGAQEMTSEGANSPRAIQSSSPESLSREGAPFEDRRDDGDENLEGLAGLWRTLRIRKGAYDFTDPAACQWLLEAADELRRDGFTEDDIERGVRSLAESDYGDPRKGRLRAAADPHRFQRLDVARAEARRIAKEREDAEVQAGWRRRERATGLTQRQIVDQMADETRRKLTSAVA